MHCVKDTGAPNLRGRPEIRKGSFCRAFPGSEGRLTAEGGKDGEGVQQAAGQGHGAADLRALVAQLLPGGAAVLPGQRQRLVRLLQIQATC